MPDAKQPNVVVVFSDQQRHDSCGLHGNPLGLTPNFDHFASRGTHVATCITPQPVCGPARACLQTGRFATAVGGGCHTNNGILPTDSDALAKRFAAAGYATGYFGKWHLGPGGGASQAVAPEHRGGWQTWLAANAIEACSDSYHAVAYDEEGREHLLPGYRSDAFTDAAIRFIGEHRNGPFLCMVSNLEPHMQNHRDAHPAPDGYEQRYHGRWTPPDLAALPGVHPFYEHLVGGNAQQELGGYWGMCKRLDEGLGRVMDALRSLGQLDNTIVVYTSDHASHFRTRNDEYKRSPHESSVRVPCMFHGGPFTGGGRIEVPFQLTDLAPTLCDAAGLGSPTGSQGKSLLPIVKRQSTEWPQEAFIQISESVCGRAVRTARWKYAVEDRDTKATEPFGSRYVETHLYDLASDPYELCNLAGIEAYATVRQEMKERLRRRMAEAGEPVAELVDAEVPTVLPGQASQLEIRASDVKLPRVD